MGRRAGPAPQSGADVRQTSSLHDSRQLAYADHQCDRFKAYRPYKQLQNNCYDYVIRFLNGIKFEGRENHQKEDIVTRFIRTATLLFASLQSNGLGSSRF